MVSSLEQHTLTNATSAAFFSQATQRELLQLWQLPEDDTLSVFAFGKDEYVPVCNLRLLVVSAHSILLTWHSSESKTLSASFLAAV